jgi:hypothetical protein
MARAAPPQGTTCYGDRRRLVPPQDADEIREAPPPYSTLREGLEGADREGFNAVNFDEFVFLPTSEEESFEGTDYVASMEYYYFFEPRPLRQVKAWKKVPASPFA